MDSYLLIIGVIVVVFIIFLLIRGNKTIPPTDNNGNNTKPTFSDNNYNNYPQTHNSVAPTPVISKHARERLTNRCNISPAKQDNLVQKAFTYGKTKRNTTSDLKAQLEKAEANANSDTQVVAKYYNGFVFIFSEEDNLLITVLYADINKESKYYS